MDLKRRSSRLLSKLLLSLLSSCGPDTLARNDYETIISPCSLGINEQDDSARPGQCSVATNVWAPEGTVVGRPGYAGLAVFATPNSAGFTGLSFAVEDPPGTFSASAGDVSSLPVGSRWYAGFTAYSGTEQTKGTGLEFSMTTTNSNASWVVVEYWNGSAWAGIPCAFEADASTFFEVRHLATTLTTLRFPWPNDVAQTTVNGTTAYFLRFTIQGADLDATVFFDNVTLLYSNAALSTWVAGVAKFPSTKRYITLFKDNLLTGLILGNTGAIRGASSVDPSTGAASNDLAYRITSVDATTDEVGTIAVVPETGEVYLAYNYTVLTTKTRPTTADDFLARVETDAAFIGTGEPYDSAVVSQLAAWPESKYIAYFRGEMWAANLKGDPNGIRWSASNDGVNSTFKIWPTLNFERAQDNIGGPITGIHGFGTSMHVFTSDGIWRMVDAGVSDFDLQLYAPEQVVAGVGFVSNSSVQEIRGNLIGLGKDGIYIFDGTPDIHKATADRQTGADRLVKTIARITPGRRAFATGAHWQAKSLYLLAVALDGSDTNSHVLVWDYKHDTWWVWDNIQAQGWLESNEETITFVDSYGRVFELGVGLTDNGTAITHTVTTPRLGANIPEKKLLRVVEAVSTNDTSSFSVALTANDEATGASGTLSYTDSAEKNWGAMVWAVDSYANKRRRSRRLGVKRAADWFKVSVTHSTKNTPFELSKLGVGFKRLGNR